MSEESTMPQPPAEPPQTPPSESKPPEPRPPKIAIHITPPEPPPPPLDAPSTASVVPPTPAPAEPKAPPGPIQLPTPPQAAKAAKAAGANAGADKAAAERVRKRRRQLRRICWLIFWLAVLAALGGAGYYYYPELKRRFDDYQEQLREEARKRQAELQAAAEERARARCCPLCGRDLGFQGSEKTLAALLPRIQELPTLATLDDAAGFPIRQERSTLEELERRADQELAKRVQKQADELFRLYRVDEEVTLYGTDGIGIKGPILVIDDEGVLIRDRGSGPVQFRYDQLRSVSRAHFSPYSERYREEFVSARRSPYRERRAAERTTILNRLKKEHDFNLYRGRYYTRAELEQLLEPRRDELCHARLFAQLKSEGYEEENGRWYSPEEVKARQAKAGAQAGADAPTGTDAAPETTSAGTAPEGTGGTGD